MAIDAETLLELAGLNLAADQMAGVLRILARLQGNEEERKRAQRERVRRHREKQASNANVTLQTRYGDVTETLPVTLPSQGCNVTPSPKRKVSPCTPSKENNPIPVSEPDGSSTKRVDAPDHEREFLTAFWPAYPHKVGKPAALKAFRSARRAAELPTILDGLRRYVAGKPPDRPWCNPTTFLNQQRWADEPATVTQGIRHDAAGRSPVADTQAAILEIYAARDADRPRPPDGEGERDRDGLPGRHSADAGRVGPASGRGGAGPVLALSARDTR